jgi:hypothetical protein
MRDHEELNRLISGEETSNRLITYCMWLGVDEFNITPPILGKVTAVDQFPSRYILLYLTIIQVLTSVGLLKSRNRFTYSDGGFSVKTEEQDQLYQRWIGLMRQQISPLIQRYKVSANIEGGWDAGVGSEYGWIHGWYGTY